MVGAASCGDEEELSIPSLALGCGALLVVVGGGPAMARGSHLARSDGDVHGSLAVRLVGWLSWIGSIGAIGFGFGAEEGAQAYAGTPSAIIGVALGALLYLSFGLDSMLAHIQANRRRAELEGSPVHFAARGGVSPRASISLWGDTRPRSPLLGLLLWLRGDQGR